MYKDNKKSSKNYNRSSKPYSPKNYISNRKKKNLPIAANLSERSLDAATNNQEKQSITFENHSHKLKHCSCFMVGRELPTGEVLRVGSNNCKSRFCVVCNGRVTSKRKNSTIDHLSTNVDNYKHLHPAMLTLTIQHDKNTNNYYYIDLLLDAFRWLRGYNKKSKDKWGSYIAGGSFSVEVTHKNDSPHIHLHVFLLGNDDLTKGDFLKWIKKKWKKKTGATQVHLTKAYYKDEYGQKLFYNEGEAVTFFEKVVTESIKYTMKLDRKDLERMNNDVVYQIATTKRRHFGFFGCLHGKGITSGGVESLTDIEQTDTKLHSPTTGEIFQKEQTQLALTHWNNTIEKTTLEPITGDTKHYYTFKDLKHVQYLGSVKEAAKSLSLHTKRTLPKRHQSIDKVLDTNTLDTIDLTCALLVSPNQPKTDNPPPTEAIGEEKNKEKNIIASFLDISDSDDSRLQHNEELQNVRGLDYYENGIIEIGEYGYTMPLHFTDDYEKAMSYAAKWYGELDKKYICIVKLGHNRYHDYTDDPVAFYDRMMRDYPTFKFINVCERTENDYVYTFKQITNYTKSLPPVAIGYDTERYKTGLLLRKYAKVFKEKKLLRKELLHREKTNVGIELIYNTAIELIEGVRYEIPTNLNEKEKTDYINNFFFDYVGKKYTCVVCWEKNGQTKRQYLQASDLLKLDIYLREKAETENKKLKFYNVHEIYISECGAWGEQQIANYTNRYRPTDIEPTEKEIQRFKTNFEKRSKRDQKPYLVASN